MSIKQTFDQFFANVNGQHIEVSDDTNINQCMDLAFCWVITLGFPKVTISHLYAKQVYTQPTDLTRQYFDIIPNTPTGVPQVGDLVVFDATKVNVAGHISISNGVGDINTFQSFDQNWSNQQRSTLITHNYNNPKVLGWLRPKLPVVLPEITNQTKIPQIIDSNGNSMEVQAIKSKLQEIPTLQAKYEALSIEYVKVKNEAKGYKDLLDKIKALLV